MKKHAHLVWVNRPHNGPRDQAKQRIGIGAALVISLLVLASSRAAIPLHILPDSRIVMPVGQVQSTPNFAIGVARIHKTLLVECGGAAPAQSLLALNAHTLALTDHVDFVKGAGPADPENIIARQSLFQGMAVGPNGMVYIAGGVSDNVMVLRLTGGKLHLLRRFPLVWQPFHANQYPYQYQSRHVKPYHFYPDSVAVGSTDHHIFVTGLLSNSVARINLRTGHMVYANAGSVPFAVVTADHGRRIVVSDWGGDNVTVLSAATMKPLGSLAVGPTTGPQNHHAGVHPTALVAAPHSSVVWVACANNDTIVAVNVRRMAIVRRINDAPYPNAPPGSYPDSLALWRHHLFVANAGNDDVAVYNTRTGHRLGLIPTGWYPSAVCIGHAALYVACAKGFGSTANLNYQWVGTSMPGTIQRISLTELAGHFTRWTAKALHNDGFSRGQRARRAAQNHQTAVALRKRIHHVVFILRENKTFDEDFGSYGRAGHWADPHLDLYNGQDLPNLYALANRFGLMVNYYVDGEVTAQGHQWTTAASDSDWVQRTWPMYYSGRGITPNPGWTQSLTDRHVVGAATGFVGTDNPYTDYENLSRLGAYSNPWISYPGGLFLFNDLLAHHVSFMDFGEFVSRDQAGEISQSMKQHLGTTFPGWNRYILDTWRVGRILDWLKDSRHTMPRLMYVWLPDDHTAGRTPGYYTPAYYVANNDLATGELVAALSRMPQWKHTLIFITEDDAQSGADHIDAHRSLALVVSPWVKKGLLITQRYSQVDIMRTMEAAEKVPPMSQWDANARVLAGIWTRHPDFAPFTVQPIQIPMALNPGKATHIQQLRRKAGRQGHWLSPQWLSQHGKLGIRSLAHPVNKKNAYTPTTLLKVPGPEQMRQEWITTKGVSSYRHVMAYLRNYARLHHQPLSHYLATADDGDK